jgi:uncharacterized protein YodC (DUF2158 family)
MTIAPMVMGQLGTGAFVALKSGGPSMTIRVIVGDTALCEWFEQGRLKQGTFRLDTLVPAPPASVDPTPRP